MEIVSRQDILRRTWEGWMAQFCCGPAACQTCHAWRVWQERAAMQAGLPLAWGLPCWPASGADAMQPCGTGRMHSPPPVGCCGSAAACCAPAPAHDPCKLHDARMKDFCAPVLLTRQAVPSRHLRCTARPCAAQQLHRMLQYLHVTRALKGLQVQEYQIEEYQNTR